MQSRVIWNSSNSAIIGYAISSEDFVSLHDVYEGLCEDEKCQKTAYVVQFLWRDLSSDFDVVGPYFNCSSSLETQSLHAMVTRTMLAFTQFGFGVRALLCDGASSNLSLLKLLCGHTNNEVDISQPSFKSPFDGKCVYLIVCPSHQVCINTAIYMYFTTYSSNVLQLCIIHTPYTAKKYDCCIVQLKN